MEVVLLPLKVPLAVLVRTVQPSASVSPADCCSALLPIADFIEECLHHLCLSLRLGLSLTHCSAVTFMIHPAPASTYQINVSSATMSNEDNQNGMIAVRSRCTSQRSSRH